MNLIYEPKGKAREYSPLALNIYNGCDHDCTYCYVKTIPFVNQSTTPIPKANILENLEKELRRTSITNQVLLSFISDPYCMAETMGGDKEGGYGITRQVLEILNRHNVPVAILTKGGHRCLRDLDLFKDFVSIKVGATLTFDNKRDSLKWEPGAAIPIYRLDALKTLYDNGIMTWASFEPVIEPKQSLNLIEETLPFIDQYKLGKWNYDPMADKIDWTTYIKEAVAILRSAGKQFYVKKNLRKYAHGLTAEESDMDFMSLTARPGTENQLHYFKGEIHLKNGLR